MHFIESNAAHLAHIFNRNITHASQAKAQAIVTSFNILGLLRRFIHNILSYILQTSDKQVCERLIKIYNFQNFVQYRKEKKSCYLSMEGPKEAEHDTHRQITVRKLRFEGVFFQLFKLIISINALVVTAQLILNWSWSLT